MQYYILSSELQLIHCILLDTLDYIQMWFQNPSDGTSKYILYKFF